MATVRRAPYPAWFLLSVLLLCLVEYWIVAQPGFSAHGVLAFAVTVDIVAGIPLLGYLLLVRTRKAQPIILAPLLLIAIGMANLVLPAEQQGYLRGVEQLLVFVELGAMVFALSRVVPIVRAYRIAWPQMVYATDAFAQSLRATLGEARFVDLLLTELLLAGHALGGWFTRYRPVSERHQTFSYHRNGGYGTVLGAVVGLSLVEIVLVHLLLHGWNPTVAWIVTALSVYGIFWLFGDFQAIRLHPVVLAPDRLYLRTGLRWRVNVPLTAIQMLRRATLADETGKKHNRDFVNLAVLGGPEYILELNEPIPVAGLFGIRRTARQLGLTVDDPAAFRAALRARDVPVAG